MNTKINELMLEFYNCINENKKMSVHMIFHNTNTIIRNTMIPIEIEINNKGIYVTSNDDFQIFIRNEINNIKYDEYDNSYCLIIDDLEMYLDF